MTTVQFTPAVLQELMHSDTKKHLLQHLEEQRNYSIKSKLKCQGNCKNTRF